MANALKSGLNQEIMKSINSIVNINTKNIKKELLIEKLVSLESTITNNASACGQYRNKCENFLWPLLDSRVDDIQKKAASCLSKLVATRGGGASGQLHQEAWLQLMNNLLSHINELVLMMMTTINGDSNDNTNTNQNADRSHILYQFDQSKSEDLDYITNRIKGLVTILINIMSYNFPVPISLPVGDVLKLVTKIFDHRVSLIKKDHRHLINIHVSAFKILETLIMSCRQLLFSHSNLIYDCLVQSLIDTTPSGNGHSRSGGGSSGGSGGSSSGGGSKESDELLALNFNLRTSVYACLKRCLLFDLLPSSSAVLKNIVDAAILDFSPRKAVFESINNNGSSLGNSNTNKQLLTALNDSFPQTKKRKRNQRKSDILEIPNLSINNDKIKSTNERSVMCVTALEALQLLMTTDLTPLMTQLNQVNNSNNNNNNNNNRKFRGLDRILIPIWRAAITSLSKIQQYQNFDRSNNNNDGNNRKTILDFPGYKLSLYRLLSAMMTNDIFRYSGLFLNAVGIFRNSISVESDIWILAHCKSTLSWLKSINYSYAPSSASASSSSLSSSFGDMTSSSSSSYDINLIRSRGQPEGDDGEAGDDVEGNAGVCEDDASAKIFKSSNSKSTLITANINNTVSTRPSLATTATTDTTTGTTTTTTTTNDDTTTTAAASAAAAAAAATSTTVTFKSNNLGNKDDNDDGNNSSTTTTITNANNNNDNNIINDDSVGDNDAYVTIDDDNDDDVKSKSLTNNDNNNNKNINNSNNNDCLNSRDNDDEGGDNDNDDGGGGDDDDSNVVICELGKERRGICNDNKINVYDELESLFQLFVDTGPDSDEII